VRAVNKVSEGRPHIVDMIKNDEIDIIVNTIADKQSVADSYLIRREALQHKVTNYTTLAAARAACEAHGNVQEFEVRSLQELHKEIEYD
jgi:carbamoyl-phosphate synthase large subunit